MGRRTLDRNAVEVLERLGFTFDEDLSLPEMAGGATRSATPHGSAVGAANDLGPADADSPPESAGPSSDESEVA